MQVTFTARRYAAGPQSSQKLQFRLLLLSMVIVMQQSDLASRKSCLEFLLLVLSSLFSHRLLITMQ